MRSRIGGSRDCRSRDLGITVFSKKLAEVLPERTEINKYAIELLKDKKLLYGPIYSPGPVELETLKIYIKRNLANVFI